MAGTIEGGKRARETNYTRHGKDFYKRIGQIGGQNGHTGGFYANPELARTAGRKGGLKSKRGPAKHPKNADAKRIRAELRELENFLRVA